MSMILADQLRTLPDEALVGLFRTRPDLLIPVPADFSTLASRAQTRMSVARALENLDLFTLEILDAIRLLDSPVTLDALLTVTAPHVGAAQTAVAKLRSLLLITGPDTALQTVSAVGEVCSPYPSGLGRPAAELGDPTAADLAADPAALRRTIISAPPEARSVLDTLAAGPPVGRLSEATAEKSDDSSPVRWLLNKRLLVPVSDETVELPREVGLLLRRDEAPLGPLHPTPPPLASRKRNHLDQAGAGHAIELVRMTEAVITSLPAPVLKSGGMGVRDLRRLAKVIDVDERVAALLLEIGYAAGLIGVLEVGPELIDGPQWLPTSDFDAWLAAGLAQRWRVLAAAWLKMPRQPSLIGTRDERERPVNALSSEVTRPAAALLRSSVLDLLAELPPGAGAEVDDILAVLHWRSPRKFTQPGMLTTFVDEASIVGLMAMGGLTAYGHLLVKPAPETDPLGIADPPPNAVTILNDLLPPLADTVLLQADLTLVVPGPPSPDLAAELAVVAVSESANVYRISPDSVRHAMDAGYSPEDLHALFARRSSTGVPQTLTYLIDDVSRKHGGLRAGGAGGYLRSEDEVLLSEIVADRRLAGLALRRLAPTVAVSPYSAARLVQAVRDAGYSPVPEDASGAVLLTRRSAPRAPVSTVDRFSMSAPMPAFTMEHPEPYVAGIIEELRFHDARTRATRRAPAPENTSIEEALAVLSEAIRDQSRVWVGYVDPHGATVSRLVRPLSIGAGYLRAVDERSETMHTFALSRINSAVRA